MNNSLSPLCFVGARFGELTILDVGETRTIGMKGCKARYVFVRCDCGTEKWTDWSSVRRGKAKTCGCSRQDMIPKKPIQPSYKHGATGTKFYKRWQGMLERCNNPNSKYFKDYGGRGITVCSEWRDFEVFQKWAMSNGYSPELQIDRINNDGPYSPDNCRWVDAQTNRQNTRRNRHLTAFGETKCASEWVRDARCQVSQSTFWDRISKGWPPEKAMSPPRYRK